MILFPLKKKGEIRVVMELDATAVQQCRTMTSYLIVGNMYIYKLIREGLETTYSLYRPNLCLLKTDLQHARSTGK